MAVLVLLRGRDQRVAARAATVLLLAGLQSLSFSAALVVGDPLAAFVLNTFTSIVFGACALWAATWLMDIFPCVRAIALRLGWLLPAWVCVRWATLEFDSVSGTVLPLTGLVSYESGISYWITLAFRPFRRPRSSTAFVPRPELTASPCDGSAGCGSSRSRLSRRRTS
ncbi:MAG TPA: hypothetical protein VKT72_11055 [Candidatus Baltobacteraceae bacterium]|nr:hypothetical protein [Candidatus Baltobacteraceae bacterium]